MLSFNKTVFILDENNCLVYLGAFLFKDKGNEYKREKRYLKEFVDQYWKTYRKSPKTLKSAYKIQVMKEVFGIKDLEIM